MSTAFFRAAPALLFASVAFSQQTSLEVAASSIDTRNHVIEAELVNRSPKTVVAFTLTYTLRGADNKIIDEASTIDDFVYALTYPKHPELAAPLQRDFILPGRSIKRQLGASEASFADVRVAAVVYRDRTAEGEAAAIKQIFDARALDAAQLTQASRALNDKSALRGIKTGAVPRYLSGDVGADVIVDQAKALTLQSRRAQ